MRQLKLMGALLVGATWVANASTIIINPNVNAPAFSVWDITSFTTDGAAMASCACQNPSITYMALTARAAAHAVAAMKRGEI